MSDPEVVDAPAMAPPPPPGPVCVVCTEPVAAGSLGFESIWGCSHPEGRIHNRCACAWLRTGAGEHASAVCPLCRRPAKRRAVRTTVVLVNRRRVVSARLRPRPGSATVRLVHYSTPSVGLPWRTVAAAALEAAGLVPTCPFTLRASNGAEFSPTFPVGFGDGELRVALEVAVEAAR